VIQLGSPLRHVDCGKDEFALKLGGAGEHG
jgi:hypothetical protein